MLDLSSIDLGGIAVWTADTGIGGQTPVDLDELDLVVMRVLWSAHYAAYGASIGQGGGWLGEFPAGRCGPVRRHGAVRQVPGTGQP